MKSIKQLIKEAGGTAQFCDLWDLSQHTVGKWMSGDRFPNQYALLLFNSFKCKAEAVKTIEIQQGDMK